MYIRSARSRTFSRQGQLILNIDIIVLCIVTYIHRRVASRVGTLLEYILVLYMGRYIHRYIPTCPELL